MTNSDPRFSAESRDEAIAAVYRVVESHPRYALKQMNDLLAGEIVDAVWSRMADGRSSDSPPPAIASPVAPSRDEKRGCTFPDAQPAALRAAAERVCWFDWSGNDMDAIAAIEELRRAITSQPSPAATVETKSCGSADTCVCEITGKTTCQPRLSAASEPVNITGWKLVPDDPTEAMWQAGRSADIHPGDSYSKVWRAMFEAAPNVDDCETISHAAPPQAVLTLLPPDSLPMEDDPDVLQVARAIAERGIGRYWDDFPETDALDTDQGDLIEYARAAVEIFRRSIIANEPQPPSMREALEDTANWLEGCLTCKTWSWDGLQRDAAEKALEDARATLALPRPHGGGEA